MLVASRRSFPAKRPAFQSSDDSKLNGDIHPPKKQMFDQNGIGGNEGDSEGKKFIGFATAAIHAGNRPEQWDMNQVRRGGGKGTGEYSTLWWIEDTLTERGDTVLCWIELQQQSLLLTRLFILRSFHRFRCPRRTNSPSLVNPRGTTTLEQVRLKNSILWKKHFFGGNPTRDVLQESIASLEGALSCRVFSSGLAATAAMANWLRTGDHIILADDGYGGTQRYFREVSVARHGVELSFVDLTKLDELREALRPNTKVNFNGNN